MAGVKHDQRDPNPAASNLAQVGVFVALFGIGLSTLVETFAVQESLGQLWSTMLVTLSIVLIVGGGSGGIYSLVPTVERTAAGKLRWPPLRLPFPRLGRIDAQP